MNKKKMKKTPKRSKTYKGKLSPDDKKAIRKKMEENAMAISNIFVKSEKTFATATSFKIETGYRLNKQKKYVKKLKMKWLPYLRRKFPYIHEKTAQRFN